jgi:hypothetical protein
MILDSAVKIGGAFRNRARKPCARAMDGMDFVDDVDTEETHLKVLRPFCP